MVKNSKSLKKRLKLLFSGANMNSTNFRNKKIEDDLDNTKRTNMPNFHCGPSFFKETRIKFEINIFSEFRKSFSSSFCLSVVTGK